MYVLSLGLAQLLGIIICLQLYLWLRDEKEKVKNSPGRPGTVKSLMPLLCKLQVYF